MAEKQKVVNILMIYFGGMVLLPSYVWLFLVKVLNIKSVSYAEIIMLSVVYFVLAVLLASVCLKDLIQDSRTIGESVFRFRGKVWFEGTKVFNYLIAILFTYLAMVLLVVLTNQIVFSIAGGPVTSLNEEVARSQKDLYPFVMLFISVGLGPVVEELVFRLPMRYLCGEKRWMKLLGLIVSSFLFASIHVALPTEMIQLLSYAVPGFVLGFIFLWTDNIWYPIGVHALSNLIATLMTATIVVF